MKSIFVPMNGETGGTVGPNGKLQTRRIKAAITAGFPNAKITFSAGHYYCSAFVRFSHDKVVYLMTSDYRHFDQNFIVRSAEDEKDYKGGRNISGYGFDNIVYMIENIRDNVSFWII